MTELFVPGRHVQPSLVILLQTGTRTRAIPELTLWPTSLATCARLGYNVSNAPLWRLDRLATLNSTHVGTFWGHGVLERTINSGRVDHKCAIRLIGVPGPTDPQEALIHSQAGWTSYNTPTWVDVILIGAEADDRV